MTLWPLLMCVWMGLFSDAAAAAAAARASGGSGSTGGDDSHHAPFHTAASSAASAQPQSGPSSKGRPQQQPPVAQSPMSDAAAAASQSAAVALPNMDQCWIMLLQSLRSVLSHLMEFSFPADTPREAQSRALQVLPMLAISRLHSSNFHRLCCAVLAVGFMGCCRWRVRRLACAQ